ncbi:hypothetical protein MICA_2163 [Micavibrio aeruginosavorus ARL-13]|uniref:Uncharacterized protein n=1 Tax=Micavibrio aeruginosavorus (strain ARL-13) TaxID=856793 RepID=G2KQZ1_MICAA|nr:hypothetical protein MICA_2163 [Micavibrio aeruginosavorus ARL-13]
MRREGEKVGIRGNAGAGSNDKKIPTVFAVGIFYFSIG